eukprot:scaffold25406_cov34-Phaeocystis_antarctica.AAC.2
MPSGGAIPTMLTIFWIESRASPGQGSGSGSGSRAGPRLGQGLDREQGLACIIAKGQAHAGALGHTRRVER